MADTPSRPTRSCTRGTPDPTPAATELQGAGESRAVEEIARDRGECRGFRAVADAEGLGALAVVVERVLDDVAGAAVEVVGGERHALERLGHEGGGVLELQAGLGAGSEAGDRL